MTTVKASIHLAATTGLPRDDVVNTLYFTKTGTPSSGDYDALGLAISHFYNTTADGSALSIAGYLGRDRDYGTNHCKTQFYVVPSSPGPTGSPVHTYSWSLIDPGVHVTLPDQVAVVNSYHSDLTGVTNPKRRRGRIFLGPLNILALEESGSALGAQTVSAGFMADIIRSTTLILSAQTVSAGWTWVQWSPTDWTARTVDGGFVDDRFDTQRRRLERTTGRLTW